MDSIPLPEYEVVPLDDIAPGLIGLHILMVNVFALSDDAGGWTLIDAGLPMSADKIRHWAEREFGTGTKPKSIILTHGHFDHVGALKDLAEGWDVPVYAHERELPFITGREEYPPPNWQAGGGIMPFTAPLYPRGPIDIGSRAHALPADGSVPNLPDWKWLTTPGHAPGHVSLFREKDKVLVVGDAFCTTKQESLFAIMEQRPELHGPPAYFTPDWNAARASVEKLADLHPGVLAPGHGQPMKGQQTAEAVQTLARDFDRIAIPEHGRYTEAAHRGS